MKVLFLDVDGVLNNSHTKDRFNGFIGLDMTKINLLDSIVFATNCKIVLSSTWRKHPEFKHYLLSSVTQLVRDSYIGDTPITDLPRGLEIRGWLAVNPNASNFVILDDDRDMPGVEDKCVFTNMVTGMTAENANEVIKRLNQPNESHQTSQVL